MFAGNALLRNYNSRFASSNSFVTCYLLGSFVLQIQYPNKVSSIPYPASTPYLTYLVAVEVDSNDFIWSANSLDSAIFRFDKTNNVWTKFNQGYKTTHITKDKRENLWFNNTTNAGVLKYDGSSWTSFDTINSCLDKRFYQPHIETFENNLWIVDNDTITGELIIAKIQPDNFCKVYDSLGIIAEPRQFVIDSTEKLWIATDKGVITFRDTGVYVNSIKKHFPKSKQVKVYPNPASSFITIDFAETQSKDYIIEIYSITGQKIKNIKTKSPSTTIDLKGFNSGLYIGKVILDSGETKSFRFVIE